MKDFQPLTPTLVHYIILAVTLPGDITEVLEVTSFDTLYWLRSAVQKVSPKSPVFLLRLEKEWNMYKYCTSLLPPRKCQQRTNILKRR